MKRNEYSANWIYAFNNAEKRLSMVKELANVAEWGNSKATSIIPQEVKECVCKHILETNSEWAYSIYVGATTIYLNKDFTVKLGVYGTYIGNINFPACKGLKVDYHTEDLGYCDPYYGDNITTSIFSIE